MSHRYERVTHLSELSTRDSQVATSGPPPTVIIRGVTGYAEFLNATYRRVEDREYDDRCIYRTEHVVGPGHGPATGQLLYMYYKAKQRAWAIGMCLGGFLLLLHTAPPILFPRTAHFLPSLGPCCAHSLENRHGYSSFVAVPWAHTQPTKTYDEFCCRHPHRCNWCWCWCRRHRRCCFSCRVFGRRCLPQGGQNGPCLWRGHMANL